MLNRRGVCACNLRCAGMHSISLRLARPSCMIGHAQIAPECRRIPLRYICVSTRPCVRIVRRDEVVDARNTLVPGDAQRREEVICSPCRDIVISQIMVPLVPGYHVTIIPILYDNYSYLIVDEASHT
jgi:hypothetical protein